MEERIIEDKVGRTIKLVATNAQDEEVVAYHDGKEIGLLRFDCVDSDAGEELKVCWMYLNKRPGYTRCGIGTAIVEWAEEFSECDVVLGRDDGTEGDGSHLTGHGPSFARYLRSRG